MSDRPTLEVPADQVARQDDDGSWLVTMESTRCRRCWAGATEPHLSSCGANDKLPPPELVALNQPCPTCDGEGVFNLPAQYDPTCFDCGGSGRLVFDLKTPCDARAVDPEQDHPLVPGTRLERGSPQCLCRSGYITHRVWLDPEIGVVPVIDVGDEDSDPIVLPAGAVPGDWTAVLRKVER